MTLSDGANEKRLTTEKLTFSDTVGFNKSHIIDKCF